MSRVKILKLGDRALEQTWRWSTPTLIENESIIILTWTWWWITPSLKMEKRDYTNLQQMEDEDETLSAMTHGRWRWWSYLPRHMEDEYGDPICCVRWKMKMMSLSTASHRRCRWWSYRLRLRWNCKWWSFRL